MAVLKIDTAGMANVITNLKEASDKYQLSIDNFFKEIEKISDCWVGPDADKFLLDASLDKKNFDSLSLILDDFISLLETYKVDNENYSSFRK